MDSRSQVSSFVLQNDRIQSLEKDVAGQTQQIIKLQQQLKAMTNERDRNVREKTEIEARMRHEMNEQVKDVKARQEEALKEMKLQNAEYKRDLEEVKQAKLNDKNAFTRKITTLEKQVQIMQVDALEKDTTVNKLRELVEQRDETNKNLVGEI